MITTVVFILIGAIIGFAAGCVVGFKIGYEGVINDLYNRMGGPKKKEQPVDSKKTE